MQPDAAAESPAEAPRVNLAERAVEETEDYLLRQWSRTAQGFEEVVAAVFRAMNYTAHVQVTYGLPASFTVFQRVHAAAGFALGRLGPAGPPPRLDAID